MDAHFWKYLPLSSSLLDGQHTGVCAKKLENEVPLDCRTERVKGIASIEPNSRS